MNKAEFIRQLAEKTGLANNGIIKKLAEKSKKRDKSKNPALFTMTVSKSISTGKPKTSKQVEGLKKAQRKAQKNRKSISAKHSGDEKFFKE